MKLNIGKFVLTIVVVLSILGLAGCLGGEQKYNVTLVFNENSVPVSGVYASYSGSAIKAGQTGPSREDGKLTILNCVGTVQIAFSKEGYSFEEPVLTVNKAGDYEIEATPTQGQTQVPKPIITVSKETAENREEGITFELELEDGVMYYYSLDRSMPTSNSNLYENPVVLTPPDEDAEAAIVIKVIGQREGWLDSEIAEKVVTYQAKSGPQQVSEPVLSVSKETAENREEGITFELELEDGVMYYYSLDRSMPTSNSNLYENPVVLTPPDEDGEAAIVIKVIGQREGWLDSEIVEKAVTYQAKPGPQQVPRPVLSVSKETAENREEGITFELELEDGVKYYYSLDGSEPTSNSRLYGRPVTLTPPNQNEVAAIVIKVIGQRDGWLDSEIAEQTVVYKTFTWTLKGSIHSRQLGRQTVIVPVEISLKQYGQIVRKETFTGGEYEFANVPEGKYQLTAVSEWCEEYSSDIIVAGFGKVFAEWNFCLEWKEEALASLSGHFYWKDTDIFTCESDTRAEVVMLTAPGHSPNAYYESGEDSFYLVSGIDPGTYQVLFRKNTYEDQDVEAEITFQPADNLVRDIYIEPKQSDLVLKTYNFRERQTSVANAILEISGKSYEIADGSIKIEDIKPGKYEYSVTADDFWPHQEEIEIPISISVNENVYLRPSLGPVAIAAQMDDMKSPQYDAVLEYEMMGGNWEIGLSTKHLDRWTTDKYYGHVKRGDTINISATVTQVFHKDAIPPTMTFEPTSFRLVITDYETTWYNENDAKLAYEELEYKTSGTYELSLSYVVPLDYEGEKIGMICEVVARTPDYVPYPVRSIRYDAVMVYDVID